MDNNNRIKSQNSLRLCERRVREVIKTKGLYNIDGTINEVTKTVKTTRHVHNPVTNYLHDDLNIET